MLFSLAALDPAGRVRKPMKVKALIKLFPPRERRSTQSTTDELRGVALARNRPLPGQRARTLTHKNGRMQLLMNPLMDA